MSRIEQDDNKNPERVAAGYKATIHNPNTSDQAKDNARQRLNDMGVDLDVPASTQHAKKTVDTFDQAAYTPDEDIGRSQRGFIEEDVRKQGGPKAGTFAGQDEDTGIIDDPAEEHTGRSAGFHGGQEGENRSLGGYKAALKNPNVGTAAKEHAKEVLRDNGAL